MAIVQKKEYLLSFDVFIIGLAYFFASGMCYPCGVFRTTTGLFKMAKFSMLAASLLNLVLSVVFGKIWGLFGIILASLVSRLLTNMWYEPFLLYKNYFEKNVIEYYVTQLVRVLLLIMIIVLMTPIISMISIEHLYIRILVKGILCVIIPSSLLFVLYKPSEEMKYLLEKIKEVLLKIKNVVFKRKENVEV
ncbi:MAG: hypothetical protein IKR04_07160 [Clostridia bacterium]|nr:hypothetical protein [Clostridia bacterium]